MSAQNVSFNGKFSPEKHPRLSILVTTRWPYQKSTRNQERCEGEIGNMNRFESLEGSEVNTEQWDEFISNYREKLLQHLDQKRQEAVLRQATSLSTKYQEHSTDSAAEEFKRHSAPTPKKQAMDVGQDATPVIIVGGGLCGLTIAARLQAKDVPVIVLEATERCGGQVSKITSGMSGVPVDIGGSFFASENRRLRGLLNEIGLRAATSRVGGVLLNDSMHGVRVRRMKAEGGPMLRVCGGMSAVIDTLVARLGSRVRVGWKVVSISAADQGRWRLIAEEAANHGKRSHEWFVEDIVVAVSAKALRTVFIGDNVMSSANKRLLWAIPSTYTHGWTFVATYSEAFWRSRGVLTIWSPGKPMREVWEQVDEHSGHFALVGHVFADTVTSPLLMNLRIANPNGEGNHGEHASASAEIRKQECLLQLTTLLGEKARTPMNVELISWTDESKFGLNLGPRDPYKYFKDLEDPSPFHHKLLCRAIAERLRPVQQRGLIFASADLARQRPGTLEGAMEAAGDAVRMVLFRRIEKRFNSNSLTLTAN